MAARDRYYRGGLKKSVAELRIPMFAAFFPDAPSDVLNFGTVQGGLASNIIRRGVQAAYQLPHLS